MFVIQPAGIRIRVENRFPFVQAQCKNYICDGENFAFSVSVSPEEIAAESFFSWSIDV